MVEVVDNRGLEKLAKRLAREAELWRIMNKQEWKALRYGFSKDYSLTRIRSMTVKKGFFHTILKVDYFDYSNAPSFLPYRWLHLYDVAYLPLAKEIAEFLGVKVSIE
jgi:hypothetical protein